MINNLAESLIQTLPNAPHKKTVLDAFEDHLDDFFDYDTEEREQAGRYCEAIMDILGIESSDGVLDSML